MPGEGYGQRTGERAFELLQAAEETGEFVQCGLGESRADASRILKAGIARDADEERAGQAGAVSGTGEPAADKHVDGADVALAKRSYSKAALFGSRSGHARAVGWSGQNAGGRMRHS